MTEARRDLIVQAAAALGALLIVVSLFLPWYSVGLADSVKALAQAGVQEQIAAAEVGGDELDVASDLIDSSLNYSGWSSLEFADALLLFVAIAAVMLVLGRRRGAVEAEQREPGDVLLLLGLLAVVTVVVLLFTKNSVFGMLESTIGFAQDKAAEFGQPGSGIDLLNISPGAGLWLGLLGSLLTLTAGFFHSLVDPTGTEGPRARATATPTAPEAQPTESATEEAPTTPQPQSPKPPSQPPPPTSR